ncbi:small cysteine and glycine repeat-containing protein 2 [Folsomia candida]|uniref:small cysteine and glycine repeat-containing protein 2 n=1 Tax=Folsomia candida TaxID=158441 RepID=UPI000B903D78|nr:small cysteine and glycine repeat-containing protein 2 [Folsomia candida]
MAKYSILFLVLVICFMSILDSSSGCSGPGGRCGSYAGVNFGTCCGGSCVISGYPPGVCSSSCSGSGGRCGSYAGVSFGSCCAGLRCQISGYPPGTCRPSR